MKVITAIRKYLNTDKEIFLQCDTDETIIRHVNKENNFYLKFGDGIANSKVKRIDDKESPDAVTIYI